MTDLQTLFRTIDELTPEEKQQIVAYIQARSLENDNKVQSRIFDLHKGKIWISDDFDDELPDSFWFGEE